MVYPAVPRKLSCVILPKPVYFQIFPLLIFYEVYLWMHSYMIF